MQKKATAAEPVHVHGPHCQHDGQHDGDDHDHDHDHPGGGGRGHAAEAPFRRATPKLGRNDPCFCGSGRKFKKCHGAAAA